MRDKDDAGREALDQARHAALAEGGAERLLAAIAGGEVVFTGLDLKRSKELISKLVSRLATVSAVESRRHALERGIEDGVVVALGQRGAGSACLITGLEVTDPAGTAVVYKFPGTNSVKTEMGAVVEAVAQNVVSRERLSFGLDLIGRLDFERLDTDGRMAVMSAIVQTIYHDNGVATMDGGAG